MLAEEPKASGNSSRVSAPNTGDQSSGMSRMGDPGVFGVDLPEALPDGEDMSESLSSSTRAQRGSTPARDQGMCPPSAARGDTNSVSMRGLRKRAHRCSTARSCVRQVVAKPMASPRSMSKSISDPPQPDQPTIPGGIATDWGPKQCQPQRHQLVSAPVELNRSGRDRTSPIARSRPARDISRTPSSSPPFTTRAPSLAMDRALAEALLDGSSRSVCWL
mmetsp:Transcript_7018/g.20748  ORF Transcript_7018/g.20748 Transcript_7018/m.20748 type:complete len:219 (-) Transcript_7018:850-1506(-)